MEEYFKDKNKDLEPVGQYRKLHEELKQAAQKAEMNKLMEIKAEMDSLVQKYPILKSLDLDESTSTNNETTATSQLFLPPILPVPPPIFKIATLRGINNNKIFLEIDPSKIPTTICGDGCSVNLKGSRLLEKSYGIKLPFSRCSSHTSSGTIRRLCTSVNNSRKDATALYENLRSILKHFAMSPKSSEMLTNATDALE